MLWLTASTMLGTNVTTRETSARWRLKEVSAVENIIHNGEGFWRFFGVTDDVSRLSEQGCRPNQFSDENTCVIPVSKGFEHMTQQIFVRFALGQCLPPCLELSTKRPPWKNVLASV